MPRPQRIEYENAFYHVINRGRGRQNIFHSEKYYQAFLDTLSETRQRFGCIIHAYCLMGNHYHLLLETPRANLSRIMRHINGVYTQRHNRLKNTDGSLFRGRYKSILVEQDAYLLQLSRYIHRNPIDMKRSIVDKLENYPWSSYPAYIGKVTPPDWLEQDSTFQILGAKQRFRGYKAFVKQGVDDETVKFYGKGNTAAIYGDKTFKAWIFDDLLPGLSVEEKSRVIQPFIELEKITNFVAKNYKMTVDDLRTMVKGRNSGNAPRKVAMYLCQELSDATLLKIADHFNLSHAGSVSYITHSIRQQMLIDRKFRREIEELIGFIAVKVT